MSVADLATELKEKIAGGDFDSSIKFNCGDDGMLVIDNQTVGTDDQETDCTVGISLEDLKAIVEGELDPTAAFMQGKLTVDGDMGVAMKLGQVLG
jgi:putative sterol carrier protein